MAKMETTEPSVDEAGKGMKKGGKAKMADGGVPMGAAPAGALPAVAEQVRRRRPMTAMEASAARPRGASLMRPAAMSRPAPAIPAQAMGRVKNGGAIESKAMHAKEERELKGIKKDLMSHESKPASKAHKGLKAGGVPKYATGGVVKKYATGGVVNGQGGFKEGGFAKMSCSGGDGYKAMKKGGSF